ncbi:uncharacterized protein LOC131235682 [Magnolia sinica]|uniref:uncharacterized protein LOC131235682 n=1 Tax=Magnolia sinica TaxID=86752 RepID=UPI00265A84FF|nr:uncharacterized protein LOC131235682 [Magnolia sinica]
MEVVIPVADFHFDSTTSSPYISAPSSPKRFGDLLYYSAPTSPSRISAIYSEFNTSHSSIPFDWEEKPGTPKSTIPRNTNNDNDNDNEDEEADYDFAFDFSGQLETPPLTAAEELFDGGKIRPLKPPPRLQFGERSPVSSPKSPKRIFRNAFSPKAKKEFDPFAKAIEETRKRSVRERGREREPALNPSNSIRRAARSHSPLRVSDPKPETSSSALKGSNKKWRLKDFLLFRSASEGSSTDKDPLRKYRLLSKKGKEDLKNASFRSTDSGGSVSGSRRGGPVSAHELHYTANRAVSEEMKKKTFLPYRQGLLGCMGFNPTAHGIAKGFHSITRG